MRKHVPNKAKMNPEEAIAAEQEEAKALFIEANAPATFEALDTIMRHGGTGRAMPAVRYYQKTMDDLAYEEAMAKESTQRAFTLRSYKDTEVQRLGPDAEPKPEGLPKPFTKGREWEIYEIGTGYKFRYWVYRTGGGLRPMLALPKTGWRVRRNTLEHREVSRLVAGYHKRPRG